LLLTLNSHTYPILSLTTKKQIPYNFDGEKDGAGIYGRQFIIPAPLPHSSLLVTVILSITVWCHG
jgi:hypothetical protein